MLSFLKITNLAILEDVSIEPGPGLNVLTGETGAGKSIIVDAIGLALGERGAAEMIRTGGERLVVEAQFDLESGAAPEAAAGFDPFPDEIVIRREVIAQEGSSRGRALVNGRLVPLSALRDLGEALADLHGQHQHQSLLKSAAQRDALDAFAGLMPARDEVASIASKLRALETEREELAARERERARREETLRREIEEIEAVGPGEEEEESLAREESLLRHAEEVARHAAEGFLLLSEEDDSVTAKLGAAEESAARLGAIDARAAEAVSAIREARVSVAEAARVLARYLDQGELDPARLEQVGARLADLQRLRRKYGSTMREVLAFLSGARAELESLGGAAARLERIAEEHDAARRLYLSRARALSDRRRQAARRLEKAVEAELRTLAMQGTRVEIRVTPDPGAEVGPHGIDEIVYLVAPNKGEELRPLSRIASGGELSRLMLAVRNACEGAGDGRTLIFDEVDSGIGGAVAEAVGRRLASLARRQQILCVTHLPQIASYADRHFRVSKRETGSRTRAEVTRLDASGRVEELARMLGDAEGTTARQHAAALVSRAGRAGKGVR